MKHLLIAATPAETALFREQMRLVPQGENTWVSPKQSLCLLHTGIGMVNTAYQLSRYLARHPVELAIQFGIAGTFDRSLALGTVVEVVSDCYPELGADSPQGYLNLAEMGFPLLERNGVAYYNVLNNQAPSETGLRQVSGLTVNRVSGTAPAIRARYEQWPAQIESMEGAAFFQTCLLSGVPFYAFRSLSNYVEARNRCRWKMKEGLTAIQSFLLAFVRELT